MNEQEPQPEEAHQQSSESDVEHVEEETIKSLRERGYKVWAKHQRKVVPVTNSREILELKNVQDYKDRYEFMQAHPNCFEVGINPVYSEGFVFDCKYAEMGGKTFVTIEDPDTGNTARGMAKCWEGGMVPELDSEGNPVLDESGKPKEVFQKGDHYVKKVGVKLALKRALEALKHQGELRTPRTLILPVNYSDHSASLLYEALDALLSDR